MQYMGGKAKIAGHVHDVIEGHRKPEHDLFIEPFMGGANISAKVAPTFKKAYLSDSNRYVVAMWKALADGWEPPTTVPKTRYLAARRGELPDHEIGYILTAYGFQGRFDGSYMDNPSNAKARNAMRQAKKLASAPPPRITMRSHSYELVPKKLINKHALIYCDPPYANTTGYKGQGKFDHDKFWDTAHTWVAAGATVLVSELTAPPAWLTVWQQEKRESLGNGGPQKMRLEKIFAHHTQAKTQPHQTPLF